MNKEKEIVKPERGQSLVELAISLTVLLILLAGLVDLGRAFFTFIALRDAAQEGASFGSVYPTFCTQIRDRVKETTDTPIDLSGLNHSDIHVLISGEDCDTAVGLGLACNPNEIKVEVELDDFKISMPFLGGILGRQPLTLKAHIADTIITNPC